MNKIINDYTDIPLREIDQPVPGCCLLLHQSDLFNLGHRGIRTKIGVSISHSLRDLEGQRENFRLYY